jgi:ABC-type multidrug transport system fused ATPase/permease subunit/CRP-like cAMP-binding protein
MEPTIFSFIWKYSKRQQILLLVFTLASFPFLFVTLELPKRIINDAIGSPTDTIALMGFSLTKIEYLSVLCFAFLAMVLVSGMMKMRINTMKGVLAERLLRRLRYKLISRMLRFPKSYFRTTSQGELVSMVTSEAEPMGGLMGDAVAQPVFQAGQMATVVVFLFMQSIWFGLASIALIPLQAWVIPMLQRQINLLNKDRIHEVRQLAAEIGESAAGISDLRSNGGWRYRLAMFTGRLGHLFEIRFQIYQKKFFMKFLNNFITQLTPFLFYLVGGYLAIIGEITVGALVAALAAYKDLSSPWKELLVYYNQTQDMALRWEIVMERFDPNGMVKEELFEGEPDEIPHLRGAIDIRNVTVRDQDGNTLLEDINLSIPHGARVAIKCKNAAERGAFAALLTREALPARGDVILSGYPLENMHQAVIAARIGYAHSRPYLFDGTLGDNLLMPLQVRPHGENLEAAKNDQRAIEAKRAGNSPDPLAVEWLDPGLAGLTDGEDIRDWWFKLVESMGIDEGYFRRTMRSRIDPNLHPILAADLVSLRPEVLRRLQEKGLDEAIHRFEAETFNPTVPLAGNLLFASPARDISQAGLAEERVFFKILRDQELDDDAIEISQAVMDTLGQTFGRDDTDHPLFLRLGLSEDMYHRLSDVAEKRRLQGDDSLTDNERAMLMTVPFVLTAEQIGPSFPQEYKDKILAIRKSQGENLRRLTGDMFIPITPDTYVPRLTVVENVLFGRVSAMAGAKSDEIENVVADVLNEHGLRRQVSSIIYDLQTGLGGAKLPTVLQERAAFSRAGIKRPDILILDTVLASHDSESRLRTRLKLRELLPDTTIIFMENHFEHPEAYDMFIELEGGRIDGFEPKERGDLDENGAADLRRKLRIIAATELFAGLDARNQRLLAFSAQWYDAKPGQAIFSTGDQADAAYLCLEGNAELLLKDEGVESVSVALIEPGRLIGDMSVILKEPRRLDLVSIDDTKFLRIGADEFRAVIESDASAAMILLEAVSGNLNGLVNVLRSSNIDIADLVKARSMEDAVKMSNPSENA